MNNLKNLLSKPLPSTRTGAFYNTFPYPTKISPEAIAVYISCFTKPGDTVLDAFGGSGSTGIAALLCQHPTQNMKQIAERLGVTPTWGSRNAVIYEIGTYGSFAAKTLTSRIQAEEFKKAVISFVDKAEAELKYLYSAKDENGEDGTIRYIIWSNIIKCPHCGAEVSYFDKGTSRNPATFFKTISCPYCKEENDVELWEAATEDVYDPLLKTNITRKKREPAWIYGITGKRKWGRAVNDSDRRLIQEIEAMPYEEDDKPRQIQWGELHRAGYHLGITHLHHFYTKRNYLVMYKLWKMTEAYPAQIKESLQLLLLSYNATHCTMMTRVVAKKNAKDFVLTGAQSGVLYISKLPVEKNILMGLKRKSVPFYDAYQLLEDCDGQITIHNSSSEKMCERNGSVNFIFTDPPFGDFIPYAEVNQINELWLDKVTNRNDEIIISASQNKEIFDYQKMLTKVFSEINRVLAPECYAVVVFHAAKARVWAAFEQSIKDAGLSVCLTSILEKTQASFKQVVSEGAVQGDPLVLLKSSHSIEKKAFSNKQILDMIITQMLKSENLDERRVYSLYITECLKYGKLVELDAKEVYAYVRNVNGESSSS